MYILYKNVINEMMIDSKSKEKIRIGFDMFVYCLFVFGGIFDRSKRS